MVSESKASFLSKTSGACSYETRPGAALHSRYFGFRV